MTTVVSLTPRDVWVDDLLQSSSSGRDWLRSRLPVEVLGDVDALLDATALLQSHLLAPEAGGTDDNDGDPGIVLELLYDLTESIGQVLGRLIDATDDGAA